MNTEGLELSLSSKLLDSFSPVFLKMDLLVYSRRESIWFELIEFEFYYLRAITYRFFFSSWNHSCDFVQISSSLVQLSSGFRLVSLWKLSFQLFEIPKYSKWELKMVSPPKEPFHLLFQAENKFCGMRKFRKYYPARSYHNGVFSPSGETIWSTFSLKFVLLTA